MAEITVGVSSGLAAKATAKMERIIAEHYVMPKPRSRFVLWRNHQPGAKGGQIDECPAIVTAVYNGMIDVMAFPSNAFQGRSISGVKHVSDPSLEKMAQPNVGGVWDFTDLERRVDRLWAERSGEVE
jgi:hypothetical protein